MSTSATLQPLHDFLLTVGSGSAALLGLLFVAVSVNAQQIVRHEDTKELARQTFISFVAVLLYALYELLPQPIEYVGVQVGATSAILAIYAGPRFVRSIARQEGRLSRRTQILRFGIGFLLQLAAMASGVELVRGNVGAINWLIGVEIALLAGAVRNSWEMLIEMGAEST